MIANFTTAAWPEKVSTKNELLLRRLAEVHLGAVVIAEDTTELGRLIKNGGNPEHDLDRLCDDIKTLLKQAERARDS
jgi:DNA integrity scanning protein DisA with diadenylate cyclase activity